MHPTPRDDAPSIRRGIRIGVDVGDVRVGVARSDPEGLIATPEETYSADAGVVARLVDLVVETAAIEVVVGLPRSLSGARGRAADKATEFAERLAAEAEERGVVARVCLVDERLTTVSAERVLADRGRRARDRRTVVDQVAAVVILQYALDTERSTGRPPGQEVSR